MIQVKRDLQTALQSALAEVAAGLDAQLTRVGARMQFVELLDQRVIGLHALTAEVDVMGPWTAMPPLYEMNGKPPHGTKCSPSLAVHAEPSGR